MPIAWTKSQRPRTHYSYLLIIAPLYSYLRGDNNCSMFQVAETGGLGCVTVMTWQRLGQRISVYDDLLHNFEFAQDSMSNLIIGQLPVPGFQFRKFYMPSSMYKSLARSRNGRLELRFDILSSFASRLFHLRHSSILHPQLVRHL